MLPDFKTIFFKKYFQTESLKYGVFSTDFIM